MSVCISITGLFFCLLLFLWKRNDITFLIQELGNYSEFGKPDDAEHINNSLNFYTKLYYIYCLAGSAFYYVLTLTIQARQCLEKNRKFKRDEVCGYAANLWLPFDYNFTPVYEIISALQFLMSIYIVPSLTISFVVFVMLQHVIFKIRHLKSMICEIFSVQDKSLQKKRLFTCIRYHQSIIRFYRSTY